MRSTNQAAQRVQVLVLARQKREASPRPALLYSARYAASRAMKTKVAAAIYFVALAAIIVLANIRETQPLFQPVRNLPMGDKGGHFLLMGGFSLMANLALGARNVRIRHTNALLGSLIVGAVVFCEEASQILVPGRTFDLMDLAADAAGIWVSGEAARWLLGRFGRHQGSCNQEKCCKN